MSAKKTQEENDPKVLETSQTNAAPSTTSTVDPSGTTTMEGSARTSTGAGPGTNSVPPVQASVRGSSWRPPGVLDNPLIPNPGKRFEISYSGQTPKTPDERKDVFIEIRALITGEGDKIKVVDKDKRELLITRRWTFGELEPPKEEVLEVT